MLKFWHTSALLDEFWNRKTLIFMLNLICNVEVNSVGDVSEAVMGLLFGWAWPHRMLYGLHMAAYALVF